MWMSINTANAPTYNNLLSARNNTRVLFKTRCIRGGGKKNWYKSKSAGVRWKQKASWALQMFALYHLNSSHWLCQEWTTLAQSEPERNLCYCVIFYPLTNQTLFFFFPLSSSQKASVPVSHADRSHGGGRTQEPNGGHRQSHQLHLSTSQSGLPRSFLRPNRAVSQTVGRENGHYFPQAAARSRPLLNRQIEERDIAAVPLSHAKLLQ